MPPVLRTAALVAALALSATFARASPDDARAGVARSYGAPLFSSLGTRDGLPNASVSSIAQDSQGFLWFGTQGGLARYDGYSFKLFAHAPFDAGSLTHDLVQTLYFDGDAIWAGTYGGLARLDLKTERFVSYSNDPARDDSLSNDIVTSIARDAKGSLWVGTLSSLDRLDEATGKFRRFRHDPADPASLPSDTVRVVKADREGRLWIGSSGGGLSRFDYAREGFVTYRKGAASDATSGLDATIGSDTSLLSDYVMAIDQDSSGRLWVGTWFGGLSLFDPASGRFENHPTADGRVYSVCAAEDGVVYVGTWGGGLFEYSIATGSFTRYRASGSSGSLANDVVYSLLRDVSGELWIGTNGGGLCKLGSSRRSYEAVSASEGGMPPGKVYAVLIDRRGYLWVGVYNEGIARRDPRSGAWRRYRHEEGNPRSLPDDIVNFLREDARGDVWAGTNGGLARYDAPSDSFGLMQQAGSRVGSLSSRIVYAMADDPSGGEWIGTFRSGLDYWDRASGRIEHYAHEGGRGDSLSDDMVTALGRDSEGRLWVGTNRGLDRLEGRDPGKGARFAAYRYDPAKPGGISSDSIRTIFLDSRKILWIGTVGGGLMRYEPETDSFVSYTEADGLPSNIVLRVLEDGAGNLWVATQRGIAVYGRAGGRFRGLSVNSDTKSAEFFSGAFAAPDGSLFFGALDRLYRFDPASYEFNDHRPPVALTSVSAKGRPPLGAAALAGLERLDLSWRGNSVSFEFAALDYRDPERNRYSYRLEGFEDAWSPPGPGHSAAYTNLPGGDYVFRVKASNDDGLWNEEGLALRLRVSRAPWASPWAFALYALLLAGGGYALARSSSRGSVSALRAEAEGLRAKLVAASASMENAAIVDSLTGLPNRHKVEEHLQLALSRAAGAKLDLAVLMVDIDHFKSYNDRYGKIAGNECLRRVAEALSACVRRSSDVVARYGGEEFLVVLEETSLEGALAEGEAVRRAVEALEIPRGDSHGGDSHGGDSHGGDRGGAVRPGGIVTVSVGCVSVQPEAGRSPASLVAEAEKALMAAKMLGRNRTSA
jgi:diguanylate cyclase (GGDEF)-like protein